MAHRMPKNAQEDTVSSDWPPEWITSYSDMTTLMMTFFIILSTMLALNIDVTWVAGKDYIDITEREIREDATIQLDKEQREILEKIRELKEEQMDELAKINDIQREGRRIQQMVKADDDLRGKVRVDVSRWKITVVPQAHFLFRSGSTSILPRARQFLDLLGQLAKNIPTAQIRISGHTDNRPINSPVYPSNWELSCGRATAVMRYLMDSQGIEPTRLSAIGYGEFHPIASNKTAEGRERNRRVEIEIIQRPPEETVSEPAPFFSDSASEAATGEEAAPAEI